MKDLKGLVIGYFKGFIHDINNYGHITTTYWYGNGKDRKRVACHKCDKTHYTF
jgi:hypothetical protein